MRLYRIYTILFILLSIAQACKQKETGPQHYNQYTDSSINRLYRHAIDIKDSNADSALFIIETVYNASRQSGYYEGMINALLGKGMILLNKGRFEESISTFREAQVYSSEHGEKFLGKINNNIGLYYMYQNNFDSAASYFQKAIHDIKEHGPSQAPGELILLYNNLANVYVQLHQHADAVKYLDEAEQFYNSLPSSGMNDMYITYVYVSRGSIYLEHSLYGKAEDYFNRALKIGISSNNAEAKHVARLRLGEVYLQKKAAERAIPFFADVLKDAKAGRDINPYYAYVEPTLLLAEAYHMLNDNRKAEQLLLDVIAFAMSTGTNINIEQAYRQLADVYRSAQQPWKALDAQSEYLVLRDSFLNKEKQIAVNQLEIKYRTAEKDKELAEKKLLIARQQGGLQKQRLWMTGIAAVTLLAIALLAMLYYTNRQKQKLQAERITTLEKEQKIVQLKAMSKGEEKERARMASELHDSIAGQLAAIKMNFSAIQHQYGLDYIAEYDEALQQLGDASDDVRKTAHNLMPAVLLQGGLYAAIQHFCKKIGSNLNISFQYYGELPKLDPEFELSVYRIIQELVQNAVKHASAKNILVQLNTTQDTLNITVEDDGIGIGDDADYMEKGTGIKNIDSRVKAFHGQLQVESQPMKGTTVYVEFETGTLHLPAHV